MKKLILLLSLLLVIPITGISKPYLPFAKRKKQIISKFIPIPVNAKYAYKYRQSRKL